jgi:uncharacterized protein (TIGR02466 family)
MAVLDQLFVTTIYRAPLLARGGESLRRDVEQSCRALSVGDNAGREWSRRNGYRGYTSYASLADLAWRDPVFADLQRELDRHVSKFVKALDMELAGRRLAIDSLWVNILESGGQHSAHIHPQSIVSGTYYVTLPKGAAGLKFEDPRLPQMMAAPMRRPKAAKANRSFVELKPAPGQLLLWESYLRHEVPVNQAKGERISVSFNYGWA